MSTGVFLSVHNNFTNTPNLPSIRHRIYRHRGVRTPLHISFLVWRLFMCLTEKSTSSSVCSLDLDYDSTGENAPLSDPFPSPFELCFVREVRNGPLNHEPCDGTFTKSSPIDEQDDPMKTIYNAQRFQNQLSLLGTNDDCASISTSDFIEPPKRRRESIRTPASSSAYSTFPLPLS